MHKKFKDWSKSDRFWFRIDVIGVLIVTLTMAVTGFNILGIVSIIFLTMGSTGLYFRNNPGSIKR